MVDEAIRARPKLDISTKYEIISLVGEGTYGFVYKAKDKQSQKKVAIKKFKPTKEGEGVSLTAYREIMVGLSEPHY
jgi:serine/threonine protein kinase